MTGSTWTCSPELGEALLGAGLEEPVFFHFPIADQILF